MKIARYFKKVFGIIFLCALCISLTSVLPVQLSAQVPFGGTIVFGFYCLNGIWLTLGGTGIPGSYMYLYGASVSPFLSGPPTHPGQNILGLASTPAPCMYYCGITVCPIGFGLTILPVHGTSL